MEGDGWRGVSNDSRMDSRVIVHIIFRVDRPVHGRDAVCRSTRTTTRIILTF